MDLRIRSIGLLGISILALVVGVITGFGAVFFRALIALIHNIAFLGTFSIAFDANKFTPPGPWGAWIILVPVIGGLIVTFLVVNFAPEARGHGVPEVLDAIYYKEGKIRPVVAAIKSLASAVSIGTGAAVGREGPIIQIGATLGSSFGQMIQMAPWQRITLVAAGAGAGIAATFNTPIGGVMFAIELMLPELSARTFLPVALATGAATFVGRIFLGLQPAFVVPSAFYLHNEQAADLGFAAVRVAGRIDRACRNRLHSRSGVRRRYLPKDQKPLSAPQHRYADGRPVDVCAVSLTGPLFRGRRRLRYYSSHP